MNFPLVCRLPPRTPPTTHLVAARADTDHTTGPGQLAVTARYDSKKDSFAVDAAYAVHQSTTIYTTYGVTDEKLSSLGLESGFTTWGRRKTFDITYHVPADMAAIKAAVRFGKTKLSTMASFPDLQKAGLAKSRIQYHLDASLSAAERLKLSFNAHTRAAKVKLSRRLDDKNRFDAEYNYIDNTSRFLCVTLKHQYNNTHSFAITGNYGAKKFTLEWDCKTENGPWTLATTFPFTDSPRSRDWHIKRRFDF